MGVSLADVSSPLNAAISSFQYLNVHRGSSMTPSSDKNSVMTNFRTMGSFAVRLLRRNHRAGRGRSLGKKRKLYVGAPPGDLRGRPPDEALERVGQVRLIEVARLQGGVRDGRAPLEQRDGAAGALDLLDRLAGQSGCPQEAVLQGTHRRIGRASVYRRLDRRIAHEHTPTDEPVYKHVGVLEGRMFPRGAVQPEGVVGRSRKGRVLPIPKGSHGEMGHERPEFED